MTRTHEGSLLVTQGDFLVTLPLKEYSLYDRLDILRDNPATQFLPDVQSEVSDAFDLFYYTATRAETPENSVDRIYAHQVATTTLRPEGPQGEAAIKSVTGRYAAYMNHAARSMRMLNLAGRELVEAQQSGSMADMTLADIFRSTPAYHGPGQLVHYLDVNRAALDHSKAHAPFAFDGTVRKSASGSRGVVEKYTSVALTPEVSEHVAEVLAAIDADQGEDLLHQAYFNEQSRFNWWQKQLADVRHHKLAKMVAEPALSDVKLESVRPA